MTVDDSQSSLPYLVHQFDQKLRFECKSKINNVTNSAMQQNNYNRTMQLNAIPPIRFRLRAHRTAM